MGRAVCRKCWTWHGSGATVCPRCGAPLQPGNAATPSEPGPSPASPVGSEQGSAAATALPPAAAPAMVGAHRRWRLAAIGGGVVVLGVVAMLLVLQLSARAVSTDGAFSVQVPAGWERFSGTDLPDGTPVTNDLIVLLGPRADGVQARVFVFHHPSGYIDHAFCQYSGVLGHYSRETSTTVAGSAALVTDCRTPTVSIESITVTHASHTYQLAFSAASSQFDRLRDGALRDLLGSWRWN